MLNSNKTLYCLLFLALTVLIIGTSCADAAYIDENDTNEHSHPIVNSSQEKSSEIIADSSKKSINKKTSSPVKGDYELNDISLYTEDIECDYGEIVDIDVVTDPEVDEGILTWYVDDKVVGARNLSTSAASYTLRTGSYIPGTHEIMVTYSASLNYVNNQTTALLTINKEKTEISNLLMNFNENNDIEVTLNVVGYDGEVLDFGTLNVYYNGENIESVEIEDYDVSFTLDKHYNMELISLEYIGDDYYDDVYEDEFVYVEKRNLNIYLPYMNAYQSTVINQSLNFYSENKVNDGVVNVYVEGVLIDSQQVIDDNVNVIIDTNNYVKGNYSVYIEYTDSDVYNNAYYQTTLRINQINTIVYTNNITAHKNDVINIRASVYNYVDETNEGLLEFLIDNESIKTILVDNTTLYTRYFIPDNLEYGLHELKVIYYGSQKYLPSQATSQLNIIKYPNSLSIRNYTLDDEGNIVLNIKEYSYQNTVDDGTIEVYVDSTLITTKEVTDNITTITLPERYEADNNYTIQIRYNNSKKYEDANLTQTISPEKYNTSTRLYTFINNQNMLNLTSYVYSTNYAQINEGNIKFYINETLIATVNVTNNTASILYNMEEYEEKTYTITAQYTGSRSYRSSENDTDIRFNFNRKTMYITTDNQIKTVPSNTITINARLTDYETNTLNITTPATIHILNTTILSNFNEGILNIEYYIDKNTEENTYNITIEAEQTKYYKNATRNIRLIVQKNSPYITAPNIITSIKGETLLINATLNYNNQILNENISGVVKINSKTVYQGKFINGQLQYRLRLTDKYTNNNYIITIKSGSTTHYNQTQKNITLNLNSRRTYITSKNIESKNGEQIIINATVYDYTTRKTVKGNSKACIKINEVTLENINITNGHILYSYVNNYSSKDYSIHIIYGESGLYNKSEWNGTLTIKSSPLQIATNNINTKVASTINIKAKILDDSKLAEGLIKTAIKINNKTINEQNITNGIIDVNYTLPDNLPVGKHTITIIAGDTRKYTHNITEVELIVTKNYKHINASDINTTTNSTITIKVDILDSNNNQVTENTPVIIKIAGKTIKTVNTTDGKIEFNYTLPSDMTKGIYDILIQAQETNKYLHATENTILKVE